MKKHSGMHSLQVLSGRGLVCETAPGWAEPWRRTSLFVGTLVVTSSASSRSLAAQAESLRHETLTWGRRRCAVATPGSGRNPLQGLCGRGLVCETAPRLGRPRGDKPEGLSVEQLQSTKRQPRGEIRWFSSHDRPEAYPTEVFRREVRPTISGRQRPHGPCVRGEEGLRLDRELRVATRPHPASGFVAVFALAG